MIPSNSPVRTQTAPNLQATYMEDPRVVQRIRITAELLTLRGAINQHAGNDQLSLDIVSWYESFNRAIEQRHVDLDLAIPNFAGHLQRILKSDLPPYFESLELDPIGLGPYIGVHDNFIYGRKSLLVHLSMNPVREGELYRSPMNPLDPHPFYIKTHNLAVKMLELLDRLRRENLWALPPRPQNLESLENDYRQVIHENRVPRGLPFEPREPRRHVNAPLSIQALRAERARQRMQMEQIGQNLEAGIQRHFDRNNNVQARLNNINQMVNDQNSENIRQIQNLGQRVQEELGTLQNDLTSLQQGMVELHTANQEHQREIAGITNALQEQTLNNQRMGRDLDHQERQEVFLQQRAELTADLERSTQEREAAFQPIVVSVRDQLAQSAQRTDELNRLHESQNSTLDRQLVGVAAEIANFQADNRVIGVDIENLQTHVGAYQLETQRSVRRLDQIGYQAEFERQLTDFTNWLGTLPNHTQEHIAPFQLQLARDFLQQRDQVANLEEESRVQLERLQHEILDVQLKDVSEKIEVIQKEENQLDEYLAKVTSEVDQGERAQVQLRREIIRVEKLIKKKEKGSLINLKTILVVGACAAVSGGISYFAAQSLAVSPLGTSGFQVTWAVY